MQPVIKHLPLEPHHCDHMTPAEVTAWLDARERQRRDHRFLSIIKLGNWLLIVGLAIVLAACLVRSFTH
ncbi:MAG: hypothetical protein P4N60_11155 [Verrucomicrobiae bacterium]|nr:hypothetical protein [Verrucomicrobiae bacterium]